MSLNIVLWLLIVVLIFGMLLLSSTMSIRKSMGRIAFVTIDTDTSQKHRIFISYLIIDLTIIALYIVALFYLSDSMLSIISISIPFLLFIWDFRTSHYKFYVDYFKKL